MLEIVTSFSEYCPQLILLKSLQLIDSYDKEFCLELLWDSLFFFAQALLSNILPFKEHTYVMNQYSHNIL